MELNKWQIFQKLDPIFAADVRRAYLIGLKINTVQGRLNNYTWRGGLMVMRNGDVYSIALTSKDVELLGTEGTSLPLVPVRLDGLCGQDIKAVDSGFGHVLVATIDDCLYQWGSIKLGTETRWTCLKPQQLVPQNFDNKRVIQVACGQSHTLAVTEQGEVYSWGHNIYGQLGNGSQTFHTDPVKISGSNGFDNKILSVACGAYTSSAVDDQGNVWSWGHHVAGALGYAATEFQLIPKRIPNINIKKMAVGMTQTVALSNANEVYFWGWHASENRTVTPVKISVQNVVDIAAMNGCRISALKTAEGQVYFWGSAYGVLIPEPVATKFASLTELFSSLDTPMMLKPVEFNLKQPRLEKLRLSFDDSETADVKFRVGGKLIYAHRMVLKLCSDHFRAMFENDWKETNEDEITLQSSDYTYESFRTFLLYLYTDRIEPSPGNAQVAIELLNLAHYYVEEDLKTRCEQQLKLLTTKSNVCQVYYVADKYKSKVLREFVMDFIIPNLNAVLKSKGYKHMDDGLQKQLIQDLVKEEVFVGLKRKRKREPSEGQ